MSLLFRYRKNGTLLTTGESNADVEWTVTENPGGKTVRLRARTGIEPIRMTDEGVALVNGHDRFLLNGYQSWTDTREFTLAETERNVYRLPRALVNRFSFDRYGDATFYPYTDQKLHGYDVFYSRGENEVFFCNVNSAVAYLIFEVDRPTGRVDAVSDLQGLVMNPGEEITALAYRKAPDRRSGLALFCELYLKREIGKLFGYTSWYNYYQNISEAQILRDLDALDDRFDLFQIDDGYETFVGDWQEVDPVKFPNGLEPIVCKIRKKGLKAGIWLAPFVAEEKSRVFREHPDWFRKEPDGSPVKCGSNWSGFYALDLSNPTVREYIAGCLRFFLEMGFDFFKLDFLYAANLPAYPGKTRCMAANEAYAFLREVLGDRLILGCGATPFNCAGIFDYLRVGPDVSLKFDDVWFMRLMHRERISTKVTLQNTAYRCFFDGHLFGNDPDVFILRRDNVSLSPRQKEALLTVNSLFGSVLMTSDNLAQYGEEQSAELNAALDRFRNAVVTDVRGEKDRIRFTYRLAGAEHTLIYHTRKGVLE